MSCKQNLCLSVRAYVFACAFVCARMRARVCVLETNSFDIIAIIFNVYKKCKSPIKKGF